MTATEQATEQFVDSSDGVQIAVYEEGNPDGPTMVLVHGWPDSHVLWDGVVPLLADRFRIVRYDNRGVGSGHRRPKPVSAYTMSCYADDFAAVIGAVAPGEQVHVLAHDWGSAGDVGVPFPSGRARPCRVIHLAVRSERRPHESIRHRQPQRPYHPRRFVRALGQLLHLVLYGRVLDTRTGAVGRPQFPRRWLALACCKSATASRRRSCTTRRPTRPMPPTA